MFRDHQEDANRREVDAVVLSDIHLGTYGCHAREVLSYLQSIRPGTLILNGDIIDMWYFRKRYFPKSHIEVIQEILNIAQSGTKVYYLTGNHDDMLRQFSDFSMDGIHLKNHLVLSVANKKYWIFHGDVFDASIQHAKWLAKLGGKGYDLLIRINRVINKGLARLGKEPYSLSKKIKDNVKKAVSYIQSFEDVACELALENGYDYVICGHIHQPTIRTVETKKGQVTYMNSGDWVENLTALEYAYGQWSMYYYRQDESTSISTKASAKKTKPISLEMIPEL